MLISICLPSLNGGCRPVLALGSVMRTAPTPGSDSESRPAPRSAFAASRGGRALPATLTSRPATCLLRRLGHQSVQPREAQRPPAPQVEAGSRSRWRRRWPARPWRRRRPRRRSRAASRRPCTVCTPWPAFARVVGFGALVGAVGRRGAGRLGLLERHLHVGPDRVAVGAEQLVGDGQLRADRLEGRLVAPAERHERRRGVGAAGARAAADLHHPEQRVGDVADVGVLAEQRRVEQQAQRELARVAAAELREA